MRKRFRNRIRELREARGITQKTLAASVGLTQGALSALECGGVRRPRLDTGIRIAWVLGANVEEVFPQPPKFVLKGEYSTRRVWLDGEELMPDKSLKLYRHSPDGFAWGYGGSGPAQLALAILLEFVEDKLAMRWYQDFKSEFIARLPEEDFEIAIPPVWAERIESRRKTPVAA